MLQWAEFCLRIDGLSGCTKCDESLEQLSDSFSVSFLLQTATFSLCEKANVLCNILRAQKKDWYSGQYFRTNYV